jgi:hypothetical protein
MFPTFIIPGAQKAGTTSLYFYLKEHPEVVVSSKKEPYFFCGPINNKKIVNYKKLFVKKNGAKVAGESSTVYMCSKKAAARIKKLLGNNIKFIFMLRNPTDRTISAYYHMAKRQADKRSIAEALHLVGTTKEIVKQEETNLKTTLKEKGIVLEKAQYVSDEPLQHFHYIRNSFYSRFIKDYLKLFPKKNFLFILTEDLKSKPKETIKKIENFLEIDNTFIPKGLGVMHNVTYVPDKSIKSKLFNATIEFATKYLNINSKILKKLYEKYTESTKPKTQNKTKQILDNIFEKEIKELGQLINLDLKKVWI